MGSAVISTGSLTPQPYTSSRSRATAQRAVFWVFLPKAQKYRSSDTRRNLPLVSSDGTSAVLGTSHGRERFICKHSALLLLLRLRLLPAADGGREAGRVRSTNVGGRPCPTASRMPPTGGRPAPRPGADPTPRAAAGRLPLPLSPAQLPRSDPSGPRWPAAKNETLAVRGASGAPG